MLIQGYWTCNIFFDPYTLYCVKQWICRDEIQCAGIDMTSQNQSMKLEGIFAPHMILIIINLHFWPFHYLGNQATSLQYLSDFQMLNWILCAFWFLNNVKYEIYAQSISLIQKWGLGTVHIYVQDWIFTQLINKKCPLSVICLSWWQQLWNIGAVCHQMHVERCTPTRGITSTSCCLAASILQLWVPQEKKILP